MAVSGQIGSYSFGEKPQVHSKNHPCIILDVSLPNTLGQIAQGTVIGVDTTSGDFVVYDPTAVDANGNPIHEPYGVLTEDIDTAQNTLAKILVFGVVYRDAINVNDGPPSADDEKALRNLNIYVVDRV